MKLGRRDLIKVAGASVAAATATGLTSRSASAFDSDCEGAPIERDVCVIGGGSSGTYTAVRLRDLGKSVVVLERKGRLGGHAETVHDPATGTPIDIGVIVFENNPLVTNYFGRFNVPLVPFPLTGGPTTYVDYRTGRVVPNYAPPGQAALGQALGTYLQLLATQFPYLDSGFNLPNPVPADLLMPFGQFVTKYNLEALVSTAFAFGQGLGNILEDPAIYVLKNFSLSVAGSLATNNFLLAPTGVDTLYDNAAAFLGNDVVLNANVLGAERSPGEIRVLVATPSGLRRVHCKKLVFCIPPVIDNLRILQLDHAEATTLTRFRANYYATGLMKLGGVSPGMTLQNVGANTLYNLPSLPGVYSITPTAAPGLFGVKFGSAEWLPDPIVKAIILADLEKMRLAGTVPVTFEGFVAFSSHAPFEMMVPSEEIAGGFYTRLNALQGHNGTYYNGAAFQTNDSSLIWQFTEGLLPKITA